MGQELTLFLSSSREWPVQQVVIKRGLSLTQDGLIFKTGNTKRCRQSLDMRKNLLGLNKLVFKLTNTVFELENIWLLGKVGYLLPVVNTENH